MVFNARTFESGVERGTPGRAAPDEPKTPARQSPANDPRRTSEYHRHLAVEVTSRRSIAVLESTTRLLQNPPPNAGSLPGYPVGVAGLGVWRFAGKHGDYFGHNGAYQFGLQPYNVVGSFAGWMAFPNDVTAAFVANSNLWFGYAQEKIPIDAFDAAS